jgi:hypothetical protein
MNDLHEKTIEINGRTYHYDPDYDCYYQRYTQAELGHWDTYGWIYTVVLLAIFAYTLERLN